MYFLLTYKALNELGPSCIASSLFSFRDPLQLAYWRFLKTDKDNQGAVFVNYAPNTTPVEIRQKFLSATWYKTCFSCIHFEAVIVNYKISEKIAGPSTDLTFKLNVKILQLMVLIDAKALFNVISRSLSCAELNHAPLIPYGGLGPRP